MLTSKTIACVLFGIGIGCGGVEGDSAHVANTADISRLPQQAQLRTAEVSPQAQLRTAETWSFVPISGMTCADGSATGIGINLANKSDGKLLIYLEGGGGCWDETTCKDSFHVRNANLNGFDETIFTQVMITGASQYTPAFPANYGAKGIWDRTSAANPFKDADYIYVPYCTADFFAGNLPNSEADGLSHVGYVNMTKALSYLSGSFTTPSTTQVVLSGVSAGALGALWNFPQTQAAFGDIPVTLIAESGPPLPAPYLASSMEEAWRVAWGLDGTKSAAAPSTHLFPYLQWIAKTYPSRKLGFIEMTGDVTISLFYGVPLFGSTSLNNGLVDLRKQMQATSSNVSFFFIPGLAHDHIHEAPSTWPTPSPPYGHNNQSLTSWMNEEIR